MGPSIGGVIIAAVGEGWCFMLDALSYLAVIASLLAMSVPRDPPKRAGTRVIEELRTGFDYVSGFVPVRTMLLLLAFVSTVTMPYTVLMPAIASRTLHGGANTLGFLMTASGAGALVGAFFLASRRSVLGLGRIVAGAILLCGVGLVAFGLSHTLWISLLVLPLVGAGFMVATASTNTIVQTVVSEELRGRVMAFYTMAFLGTAPIGSLLSGVLADHLGSAETVIGSGVACALAAIWFATRLPRLRNDVRPVYIERGILPAETEAGIT
jgi:predicted MFS family arabinose efflux permease